MALDLWTADIFAISALGALATAAIAFLTFSKQAGLRPVPVRRTDMRRRRNRR